MMRLYIVTTDDGEVSLVNITPDNAKEMKERGWEVLDIGLSGFKVMPGVLARKMTLDPKFVDNKEPLLI